MIVSPFGKGGLKGIFPALLLFNPEPVEGLA
jgi:hypothetical protein